MALCRALLALWWIEGVEKLMTRLILTLLVSFGLSACGAFNGREDALFDARYQHPISVDPQVVTFQMDVPKGKVALTVSDKAAIDAFARTYKSRGHGALTIAAPSGSPNEAAAVSIVAETRAALADAGLSGSEVGYAAYRASSANSSAPDKKHGSAPKDRAEVCQSPPEDSTEVAPKPATTAPIGPMA